MKFIKCDEDWVNFSEIKEIWIGKHDCDEGFVIYQTYGYGKEEHKQLFNTLYDSYAQAQEDLDDFMNVHFGDNR